jgi:hypothetical protein
LLPPNGRVFSRPIFQPEPQCMTDYIDTEVGPQAFHWCKNFENQTMNRNKLTVVCIVLAFARLILLAFQDR